MARTAANRYLLARSLFPPYGADSSILGDDTLSIVSADLTPTRCG